MYDIVALGELLVDFIQEGMNEEGHPVFSANPGGAPCNMLAMASKMGKKTGFIGKVGKDSMGKMLRDAIISCGIDDRGLRNDDKVPTTLAFVSKTETGDRNFSFYRNPGADMMLTVNDIDFDMIQNTKIFHFGTLSMTHDGVRKATKKAVDFAKQHQKVISFDPNIRELLWQSMDLLRDQMDYGFRQCHILKISDNEIQWFTGEEDLDKAIEKLKDEYNIPLIFLTMGKDGSRAYYRNECIEHKGYVVENTVDTTGAGDTFMGTALSKIVDAGIDNLNPNVLLEILKIANKSASLITMRKGALTVMPDKEDIEC